VELHSLLETAGPSPQHIH